MQTGRLLKLSYTLVGLPCLSKKTVLSVLAILVPSVTLNPWIVLLIPSGSFGALARYTIRGFENLFVLNLPDQLPLGIIV